MEFKTIHLNYYEIPDYVKIWLQKMIKNDYGARTNFKKKLSNKEIEGLFEINNAGIDIDVFGFMSSE